MKAADQADADGKAQVGNVEAQLTEAKALIVQLKVSLGRSSSCAQAFFLTHLGPFFDTAQRQVADLKPMASRTREAESMAERMVAAKVRHPFSS